MSDRLTDSDLDRIEQDARDAHAPADFVPAQILSLIEEVKHLRAEATPREGWTTLTLPTELASYLEGKQATVRTMVEVGMMLSAAEAQRDAATPSIDVRTGQVSAPSPTPLDTGRWERDGDSFVLTPPGHSLGLFLSQSPVHGHWEIAREADDRSVAVTAADLEAAAAIIRSEERA